MPTSYEEAKKIENARRVLKLAGFNTADLSGKKIAKIAGLLPKYANQEWGVFLNRELVTTCANGECAAELAASIVKNAGVYKTRQLFIHTKEYGGTTRTLERDTVNAVSIETVIVFGSDLDLDEFCKLMKEISEEPEAETHLPADQEPEDIPEPGEEAK